MLSLATPPSREHLLLLERFLARRTPATRATYLQGLQSFARWIGAPSPAAALAWLLSAGVLEGNARVAAWLDYMEQAGRASATVAVRLSALRSAVQMGRVLGMVSWDLEIPPPRLAPFRDTRGPGPDGVQALLRAAMAQPDRDKGVRDLAILRLLYDLGLRRGEVAALSLRDLEPIAATLKVRKKGQRDPDLVTLPPGTLQALQAWLSRRGGAAGPIFHRLDNGGLNLQGHRALTGRAIWDLVHELGLACGIKARPHGLRHSAITDALDAGFDVRAVHRFGRWKSRLDIILAYDDNRKDLGGAIAGRLAGGVHVH